MCEVLISSPRIVVVTERKGLSEATHSLPQLQACQGEEWQVQAVPEEGWPGLQDPQRGNVEI